jgi:hypothetical protein
MLTALGILGSIVLAKVAFRAIRCRHGGGCGAYRMHRFHRRWHRFGPPWRGPQGPIDLGDLDDLDSATPPAPTLDVSARVDELLRGLELNARQAAEAGDVISILRASIGPRFGVASEVLLALRAAGKTPFDADLAEAALGPKLAGPAGREARDALEHLHNILTEEQRTALLRLLPRPL